MSDHNLNEENLTEDDIRLLDLIDGLAAEDGRTIAAGDAPGARGAEREWLETLGLLPYELDQAVPRPEVKRDLMALVQQAPQIREISTAGTPAEPHSLTSRRLVALERRARWYMPIAATFAFALLGVTAFQFSQIESQRRTIADLSSQLERVEPNGPELASIRSRLDQQGSHLKMLTSLGAEYCVLRPVGEPPRFPGATATMVISPERNRWYLAAEGLEPCPGEVCYELWFVTDGDPIRAAAFDAENSFSRIELSGSHEGLPLTVRAITITRAPASAADQPTETVLLADQAMTLL